MRGRVDTSKHFHLPDMHLRGGDWSSIGFGHVSIKRSRTDSGTVTKVLRYIKGAYEKELPAGYDAPVSERWVNHPALHIRIEMAPGEILPNTARQNDVHHCISDILYLIGASDFPFLALRQGQPDRWTNTESAIHIITRSNMPGTRIDPYTAEVAVHDLCRQHNQDRGWDTHYREGSAEMVRLIYREPFAKAETRTHSVDAPPNPSKFSMER